MAIENECKIYQFKVNEEGVIVKNEIDYKTTKGEIFFMKGGQVDVYKRDLGKWRKSYMYTFDPDLEKARKSLMESLKGKIENNRRTIELKMQTNAEYEKLLKKLADKNNLSPG